MDNATIKVSNVSENDYGIKVGYKPDNGPWENYFVNDEALFSYFTKGATLVVEYTTTAKGNKVVKGVSTATTQQAAAVQAATTDPAKNKSIEKQTLSKCAADMFVMAGSGMPTAFEFAAWVNSAWTEIFGTPDAEQLFTDGADEEE